MSRAAAIRKHVDSSTCAKDRKGFFRAESLEVGVFSVSEKKNSPHSNLSALKSPCEIGAGARSSTAASFGTQRGDGGVE
jgi:hypothetical protein